MKAPLRIAFFGSSLVSAWWNGAATYYRGILKALHERGHQVTFFEPDAFDRQHHRDIDDPPYARVVVYRPDTAGADEALEQACNSDIVIKASGVGVLDEYLDEAVANLGGSRICAFWDVDAPATLERVETRPDDPFARLVPRFDIIFTYGGGWPVMQAYHTLGARICHPIYNALDPATHFPVAARSEVKCDLLFIGNRLPDRELRVEEFFLEPARRLPQRRFLLGGNGWQGKPTPFNVRLLGHVYTKDHNVLNSSALAVLNIARDSMARYGYSPATRVFEAAGAGACIITDAWRGLDMFLEPQTEILVARDDEEVIAHLRTLETTRAREIGAAARKRILAEHCYSHRAIQFENILKGNFGGRLSWAATCGLLSVDYRSHQPGAMGMPPRIAG